MLLRVTLFFGSDTKDSEEGTAKGIPKGEEARREGVSVSTLTLSMIVKNEEVYLKDCLESVKNIADEIVIVDTGSTDRTIEIAESYNAKVFHFDWIDDFAAARNFALSKSTSEWILYLDADERLCSESLEEIKQVTKTGKKEGYRCIVNCIDDKGGRPQLMRYTRLFYNTGNIQFKGAVHEQIDESLLQNGYRIIDSGIEILHIGYNVSEDIIRGKAERNIKLLLKEYSKKSSSYYAYQLGNTYSILKDDLNAKKYYMLALDDERLAKDYKTICFLHLAGSELDNHKPEEALKYVTKGLNIDRTHPLLNLMASQIFIRLNNAAAGINLCKTAFEQVKKTSTRKDSSVLTIAVSQKQIVYQGLLTSLYAGSKPDADFFIRELERVLSDKNEFLFIKKLYCKENIQINEIPGYKNKVNEINLDTFLFLIEQYPDKKTALMLLSEIKEKYSGNAKFLTKFGLIYLENNYCEEAIRVMETSLSLKEKDPSAVFYLISAYVKSNQWDKIPDILMRSEEEFGYIPEFISKLKILKNKLEPYLKTK